MPSPNKAARGVSYPDRFVMPQKLRAVSPEELDSWSDTDSDATFSEPQPSDVDEPWPYTFRVSGIPSRILNGALSYMICTARRTSMD